MKPKKTKSETKTNKTFFVNFFFSIFYFFQSVGNVATFEPEKEFSLFFRFHFGVRRHREGENFMRICFTFLRASPLLQIRLVVISAGG